MGAAAVAASASANLEVLRAGLEREAQARVALGAETAEQLKQTPGRAGSRESRGWCCDSGGGGRWWLGVIGGGW